jgi:hypothetical protein
VTDIENCPVHPHQFDPDEDCDGCKKEVTARTARIEQLQAEAQQRVAGLARQGVGFPAQALDSLKVDILWHTIFQGRQAFLAEEELGRQAIELIKSIQSDANKASLLAPGPKNGLHIVNDRKNKQ